MSLNNESQNMAGGATVEKTLPAGGVYASLFDKINLDPVAEIGNLNGFDDNTVMAETSANARVTAAVQVFMQCLQKSGQKVEKLDKTLLDSHIAELDFQISRQLDEIMHNDAFQKVESVWRGLKSLVDKTDFRQNVKLELLDLSKEELRQDFEDSPEIIQSGLYKQTYIAEYDTPGGEPISAQLDALDRQKGKYMTGSELKTIVWRITSTFSSAVPAEEQLRQLVHKPGKTNTPGANLEQAARHLDSLIHIFEQLPVNKVDFPADNSVLAGGIKNVP